MAHVSKTRSTCSHPSQASGDKQVNALTAFNAVSAQTIRMGQTQRKHKRESGPCTWEHQAGPHREGISRTES